MFFLYSSNQILNAALAMHDNKNIPVQYSSEDTLCMPTILHLNDQMNTIQGQQTLQEIYMQMLLTDLMP